jgi:quercetin dioxygenase-like cupin family protein
MTRLAALLLVVLLHVADQSLAQSAVDAKGVTPTVKLEEVLAGHLSELNGKFKLRVTEVTIAPGGHLGEHHHAGPGIRLVTSGKLTFTQAGKPVIIYQPGDYFFEAGNVVHTAQNHTKSPVRLVFVEILPAAWQGPSVIPPKAY